MAFALCASTACGPANSTNIPTLPPVPPPHSPVQVFRELLVKTPQERNALLALRPPGLREPLEAKIREYLALAPEERELRLQATELRYYLLQLMALPATNRPPLLAQIAEPMRTAVAARLEVWQLLPPPMQAEVLENEQAVRYFTQVGVATESQRQALIAALPADQRADIARFQALPEDARARVFTQFGQFFDLTLAEREKALRHLSEPERQAMEQTLNAFAELTPEQRRTCIHSFEKFAGMIPAERQEFLKNAAAWQQMSPSERERWRMVVARMPELPPLPPGLLPLPPAVPPPPLPPVPKAPVPRPSAAAANGE